MEVKIQIDRIDYGGVARRALPIVLERLSAAHEDSKLIPLLQKLGDMPGGAAQSVLNVLPQRTKDQIAAAMLESCRDELAGLINDFAAKKGFDITVSNITLTP